MLALTIKSDAFIPYKRAVFTKWIILKRGRDFIFALNYCH